MPNDMSTIKLSKTTKKKLANLGSKEDSYEDIIIRLLKKAK